MTDPREPYAIALRGAGLNFNIPGVVAAFDAMLDKAGVPRAERVTASRPAAAAGEPRWLIEARRWIGTKEIPGPRHNSAIVKMRMALGGFGYKNDDIPWCGDFTAHCIKAAGLAIPKLYPRALAWADWGKPCPPTVGAVVVFKRQGGGHVGFLLGESAANYYVLGGNQSNAVNIMPLAKARAVATRWPKEMGLPAPGLPRMTGGTVSVNEA